MAAICSVVSRHTLSPADGWQAVWDGVRTHGAVVVSDAASTIEEFRWCTEQLGANFGVHHSPERSWVSGDGTVQTVSGGCSAIAFHSERAYLPTKPELLYLFCCRAARIGGETLLCDGAALLEMLPTRIRDEMASARLTWQTRLAGSARQIVATVPCIERGWIGGRDAFANYLLLEEPGGPVPTRSDGSVIPAYWRTAARAAARRRSVALAWKANELLVLDNTRWLHGRRATRDARRLLVSRMSDARLDLRLPAHKNEARVPRI
jgi:alpha-ketoglutarate-dependent taurine dioxygenase